MSEPSPTNVIKQHQISQDDLAVLERDLPALMDRMSFGVLPDTRDSLLNDTTTRMAWRRVQRILTDVRWGYGPPEDVEIVDGGFNHA